MNKLLVISLSIIIMFSMLLTGCLASPIQTAATLVPERADAIANVKIAEILDDEDISDLYACIAAMDPYAPQTLSLALDEFRDETGVDLRYFNEAVLFADTSTIEATVPYVGAIVECNIPTKQVSEILQQLGIRNYKTYVCGYEIYGLEDDINVTFLSSSLVAFGPRNVVLDIIDVSAGGSRPIGRQLYDLNESLGNPLVKAVFKVPPLVSQQFPIEIPLDMAAGTFDKDGLTMYLQLQLYFASSSIASDSKDVIQEFIARNMLNKVEVVIYDSQVSVQAEATVDEVKDLTNVLKISEVFSLLG